MKIHVDRYAADTESTIGRLYIDGEFECFTLEDQARDGAKVRGETRIPSGEYAIKLRPEGGFYDKEIKRYGGDWHKGMLHLQDVPNFQYILIHSGNYETQTEGCLLVGKAAGVDGKGHHCVLNSRGAYEKLYPKVRDAIAAGQTVTIQINDTPTTQVPVKPVPSERPGAAATGTVIAGGVAAGAGALIVATRDEGTNAPATNAPATPAPPPADAGAPPAVETAPDTPPTPGPDAGQSKNITTTGAQAAGEVWPPQKSTLGWGVIAIGAIVVLLGLYLLLVRFREWRQRRAG